MEISQNFVALSEYMNFNFQEKENAKPQTTILNKIKLPQCTFNDSFMYRNLFFISFVRRMSPSNGINLLWSQWGSRRAKWETFVTFYRQYEALGKQD